MLQLHVALVKHDNRACHEAGSLMHSMFLVIWCPLTGNVYIMYTNLNYFSDMFGGGGGGGQSFQPSKLPG